MVSLRNIHLLFSNPRCCLFEGKTESDDLPNPVSAPRSGCSLLGCGSRPPAQAGRRSWVSAAPPGPAAGARPGRCQPCHCRGGPVTAGGRGQGLSGHQQRARGRCGGGSTRGWSCSGSPGTDAGPSAVEGRRGRLDSLTLLPPWKGEGQPAPPVVEAGVLTTSSPWGVLFLRQFLLYLVCGKGCWK